MAVVSRPPGVLAGQQDAVKQPGLVQEARCRQVHPGSSAVYLSRHFVLWLWPVLRDGLRRPVMKEDIWPLPPAMGASVLMPRFEAALRASCGAVAGAVLRLAWRRLTLTWLTQITLLAVLMAMPMIIVAMIRFLEDPTAPLWQGLAIAAGGLFLSFMQGNCAGSIHRNAIGKATEVRLQTTIAIFGKALRLRGWGCGAGLVSRCIAGMTVDCDRVYYLLHMGQWTMFMPSMLVTMVVILAFLVGLASAVVGAVCTAGILLTNAKLAQLLMHFRRRMQVVSAQRLLLSRQALDGIRNIKMYGWVEPVEHRIAETRAKEEHELSKYLLLRAFSTTVAFNAPAAVMLAILGMAVLLGHDLSMESIFVVMAMVNGLRGPMSGFPMVIGYLTDGFVSAGNVGRLLALPEVEPEQATGPGARVIQVDREATKHAEGSAITAPVVVELRAAHFSWDGCPPSTMADVADGADAQVQGLADIDLQLQPGELCCVVGPVGGGKSSLVSAILGNMALVAGERSLRVGSVAYCPQEPWILSRELWNNVALGCDTRDEVDAKAYALAVECAELATDLALLPAGDATEIGPHGINLSGGQKARVALARALYQCQVGNSDLVVLDDVLSAVDIGVAQRLVSRCILGDVLCKRTRIVVLNSHYELLQSADKIAVMAGGKALVYDGPAAYSASPWAATLAAEQRSRDAEDPDEAQPEASPTSKMSEVPSWIAAGLPATLRLGDDAGERTPAPAAGKEQEDGKDLDTSGRLLIPEDRKVGILSFGTYRLYFGHGACGHGAVLFAFVLLLVLSAEALRTYSDLFLAEWASAPLGADGKPEGGNEPWILHYTLISGVTLVLSFLRSAVFMAFARRSSSRMHQRMLARALRAPVNLYFDTVPTPQILNRLSKDLDVVDSMLPYYLLEFFQDWGFLLCTFIVVLWKAPLTLVVLPPCAYGFVKVRACYMATSRELKRLEAVARSPLLTLLSEAMEGITTIRAQRLEAVFKRRFEALAEQNGTLFWHSFILLPWMITRVDGLGAIFVFATGVSLTVLRSGGSTVSGAVAFTFIINFIGKLQWAMRQSIEAENYLTSVERCEHFEHIPQENEPADGAATPAAALQSAAEGGKVPAVEFRSVSVRYRPGLPLVIKGLSFTVQPGERVGVIGRTGCGKSTLTLCLFRMLEVEASGAVLIHGVDVQNLSTTDLRRSIAAVPQVPLVYAGSLRENLDPLAELRDEQLWEALEHVDLADFVQQAGGLNMAVAEGGANMSAGQRQLLTITRALLRKAKVVVFDEATSSCDPKTDALVQRMLRGRSLGSGGEVPFLGAAVLTIAHRLDTLAFHDRVLLLGAPQAGGSTSSHEIRNPRSADPTTMCALEEEPECNGLELDLPDISEQPRAGGLAGPLSL